MSNIIFSLKDSARLLNTLQDKFIEGAESDLIEYLNNDLLFEGWFCLYKLKHNDFCLNFFSVIVPSVKKDNIKLKLPLRDILPSHTDIQTNDDLHKCYPIIYKRNRNNGKDLPSFYEDAPQFNPILFDIHFDRVFNEPTIGDTLQRLVYMGIDGQLKEFIIVGTDIAIANFDIISQFLTENDYELITYFTYDNLSNREDLSNDGRCEKGESGCIKYNKFYNKNDQLMKLEGGFLFTEMFRRSE